MQERLAPTQEVNVHNELKRRIGLALDAENYLRDLKAAHRLDFESLSREELENISSKESAGIHFGYDSDYDGKMGRLKFQNVYMANIDQANLSMLIEHDLRTPLIVGHEGAFAYLWDYLNPLNMNNQARQEKVLKHLKDNFWYIDPAFIAHERRVLQSSERSIWKSDEKNSGPIKVMLEDIDTFIRGLNKLLPSSPDIKCNYECGNDVVVGNEPDVYRILWNLIYNAHKAMNPEKDGKCLKEGE